MANEFGVINVESDVGKAYTKDHADVLRRVAEQVGWVYFAAKQRRECCRGLDAYLNDMTSFSSLMKMSRHLSDIQMHFILWESDYLQGRLMAHSVSTPLDEHGSAIDKFSFGFRERSLATLALGKREAVLIDDVDAELQRPDCRLANVGCKAYQIRGPLAAVPVYQSGNVSAILVGWSEIGQFQPKGCGGDLGSIYALITKERMYRMAQLIANDCTADIDGQTRAGQFLKYIDEHCRPIDDGKSWTEEQMLDKAFANRITDVLLMAYLNAAACIECDYG